MCGEGMLRKYRKDLREKFELRFQKYGIRRVAVFHSLEGLVVRVPEFSVEFLVRDDMRIEDILIMLRAMTLRGDDVRRAVQLRNLLKDWLDDTPTEAETRRVISKELGKYFNRRAAPKEVGKKKVGEV